MKRVSILSCLLMGMFAPPAFAQITIDAAFYESQLGETVTVTSFATEDVTGVQAIVDANLSNGTYDFSTLAFGEGLMATTQFLMPTSGIPGADNPAFSSADFVAFSDGAVNASLPGRVYSFFDIEPNGLFFLGVHGIADFDQDGLEETSITTLDPSEQSLSFPAAVGASWTSTYTTVVTFEGVPTPGFETVVSAVVEGWGTLVTPAGSASCLRIRRVRETNVQGTVFTSTELQFLSTAGLGATIILDESGPVTATYSVQEAPVALERSANVPDSFVLAQNYPNPFNPFTVISFDVAEAGPVTLRVYDLLGHEVATLVRGFLPAGTYDFSWQADNLPSGVYLYQLKTGTVVLSRKMILQK